ncbi:helix-turn-helix domain-containing protein [Streptomyces sp. MUM 178J]|uniref:helix-turn-helix domain-containing protein n=1 Tax=Streptomyces sp. MUM 178J TaxID=2791991 RepID=UPI001F044B1D|nr:MerR family transcriptional regulator [Streptomyces sp. MUM 178J]WRQ79187.1 MerR family transcriptional regulator [Streptomyces sp. MUM 178J]
MRISEIAALVGVTPRAVRHYGQLGLLPEPDRLSNGYRDYGLRHAVVLARVRRLTELGMGLAEVRDVLADDAGRELAEVLEELDDDLARQEAALAERRARLGELMKQAREGRLPPEGPVSPELAGLLAELGPSDSPMAAKDRAHLALLDGIVDEEQRGRLFAALRPYAEDPDAVQGVRELYARLDDLAGAEADDPRVVPLGDALAASMPDGLLELMGDGAAAQVGGPFGEAFLADFAPAQAAAVRRMLAVLAGRAAGRTNGAAGRARGAK